MLAISTPSGTQTAPPGPASTPVVLGRPNLPRVNDFTELIREAFSNQWLSNCGPLVRRLEDQLRELLEVRNVIAVVNATTAIQLLAKACRLGGEVVVPAFTFPATAQALTWIGLTPVFADVDPATATLTAATVEPLLNDRTSAIVAVNLWGNVGPIEELKQLARSAGVPLILDAAQALGVQYQGRCPAVLADAGVLSLHATKIVSACEGGLVVTDDDELAAQVRAMHNFGTTHGRVVSIGTNAKMHEVSAAMALSVLPTLPQVIADNRRKHLLYRELLAELAGISIREPSAGTHSNYHYVVAEVEVGQGGVSRDRLQKRLQKNNIHTKAYFAPGCHVLPPYCERPRVHSPQPLPGTEALAARVLCLPTGPGVSDADIGRVCDAISEIMRQGRLP